MSTHRRGTILLLFRSPAHQETFAAQTGALINLLKSAGNIPRLGPMLVPGGSSLDEAEMEALKEAEFALALIATMSRSRVCQQELVAVRLLPTLVAVLHTLAKQVLLMREAAGLGLYVHVFLPVSKGSRGNESTLPCGCSLIHSSKLAVIRLLQPG